MSRNKIIFIIFALITMKRKYICQHHVETLELWFAWQMGLSDLICTETILFRQTEQNHYGASIQRTMFFLPVLSCGFLSICKQIFDAMRVFGSKNVLIWYFDVIIPTIFSVRVRLLALCILILVFTSNHCLNDSYADGW